MSLLVIVTYDVSTETAVGRRRLRRVAKVCESYGQRVQKSVFECVVGDRELIQLRSKLVGEIDAKEDSLRLYFVNEGDRERIEEYGARRRWDYEGPLIV